LHTEVLESRGDITEGNELSNAPKNSFNLWTTYQLLDNLQFGFGAQYIDDRFNSTANTRVAPSYITYELNATYQINSNANIRVNLQNVTDEEYIDYVGGGHFIPGLARFAMVSANFSF
jgi:catecholate siderophore receptor